MAEGNDLEKAVEIYPEVKDFVDYVRETGGQDTLKVENGEFVWSHQREFVGNGRPICLYMVSLTLDRKNPELLYDFRECQIGAGNWDQPKEKGEELLKKLPELFKFFKKVYDKCFVRDEDVFREVLVDENDGKGPKLGVRYNI